jgi:hypothetical protein
MKKSQNMPIWVRLSEIGFGPEFDSRECLEADKRHSKAMHLSEKRVINMIWTAGLILIGQS